jgi:hypothetical protein
MRFALATVGGLDHAAGAVEGVDVDVLMSMTNSAAEVERPLPERTPTS